MKGICSWQFTPYIRPTEKYKELLPYISRIIPFNGGFSIDWFDKGVENEKHYLCFRAAGADNNYTEVPIDTNTFNVTGLKNNTDYECFIKRNENEKSDVRIVRTGKNYPDATVINYLHPNDNIYSYSGHAVCAPSIVRLPSGKLLVLHDVPCDRSQNPACPCLAILLQSEDNGKTWKYVCDIRPAFNPMIFLHNGELYILALSTDYTDLIIGKSVDEGKTWTSPVTILRGENINRFGWHRGAMPFIEHNGTLYTSVEYGFVNELIRPSEAELKNAYDSDADPKSRADATLWRAGDKIIRLSHYAGVLSIRKDADMLKPENWCVTPLYFPGEYDPRQCIEGNLLILPDGKLYDFLRTIRSGKSLLLKLDEKNPREGELSFVRLDEQFPLSSQSKFDIKYDEASKRYIAFGNLYPYGRRTLVMAVSKDFENWDTAYTVADVKNTPDCFSYPSWIFDGEDILLVSRTAYNGATNQHDTNMITFHKIKNYRQYIK